MHTDICVNVYIKRRRVIQGVASKEFFNNRSFSIVKKVEKYSFNRTSFHSSKSARSNRYSPENQFPWKSVSQLVVHVHVKNSFGFSLNRNVTPISLLHSAVHTRTFTHLLRRVYYSVSKDLHSYIGDPLHPNGILDLSVSDSFSY